MRKFYDRGEKTKPRKVRVIETRQREEVRGQGKCYCGKRSYKEEGDREGRVESECERGLRTGWKERR